MGTQRKRKCTLLRLSYETWWRQWHRKRPWGISTMVTGAVGGSGENVPIPEAGEHSGETCSGNRVRIQPGCRLSERNGFHNCCKARHNAPKVLTENRTGGQWLSEEGRPVQLPWSFHIISRNFLVYSTFTQQWLTLYWSIFHLLNRIVNWKQAGAKPPSSLAPSRPNTQTHTPNVQKIAWHQYLHVASL